MLRDTTRRIRLVPLLVAVALMGGLVACGEDERPARADIIAKIKADPQTAGTPDRTAECIADWYLKYATPEQLAAFMDGRLESESLAQTAGGEEARTAIVDCLKSATVA